MSFIKTTSLLLSGLALSLVASAVVPAGFVPATASTTTVEDGIDIDCDGSSQLCGPHVPPPPPPSPTAA